MSVEPWSPAAFELRYRAQPDPWNFEHSDFEQGRYDAILASLPRERYRNAYEPGCSVGALTVRLAARCDALDAVDVSATAVARAQERCRSEGYVQITVGSVAEPPPPDLDLVVLSEIGYYFDIAELDRIAAALATALRRGGDLVACHWLGESADHRLHGSVVHERLRTVLHDRGLVRCVHAGTPDYVIDGWSAP
jgi:predicted TPR repeat methyltransferase